MDARGALRARRVDIEMRLEFLVFDGDFSATVLSAVNSSSAITAATARPQIETWPIAIRG